MIVIAGISHLNRIKGECDSPKTEWHILMEGRRGYEYVYVYAANN